MGKYPVRIIKDNVGITLFGKRVVYNRGEWVEVGKETALSLVSQGKAEMMNINALLDAEDVEIILPDEVTQDEKFYFKNILVSRGYPNKLTSKYNIFFDDGYCYQSKNAPGLVRNPALFANMVELLHDFDVILILRDYAKTVQTIGRELDITKELTFDNRIMSYQTCAVGIAGNKGGKQFYTAWQDETKKGEFQALVRALFLTKPFVYYVPPNWGIV